MANTVTIPLIAKKDGARSKLVLQIPTIHPVANGTIPSVPTNLRTNGFFVSNASVTLTWNSSTGIPKPSYYVYRNNVKIANTANNSYIDHNTRPWNFYQYTVSAYNSKGTSANSNLAYTFRF